MKAAFLVNFVRFVEWPEDAAPAVIAVIEPNVFGGSLTAAASDATLPERLRVIGVPVGQPVPSCRVVFAPKAAGASGTSAALAATRGTLTVGETEEFLARGGIVRLAVLEGKVRVEINVSAAERSGLELSSRLLSVATLRREEDLR